MKKWLCLLLVAIILTALTMPASATTVPTYSISEPKQITVDGRVTEKEWGKPIYKGVTLQEAEAGKIDEQVSAWWFDSLHNRETSFDFYATNNDIGIGFACVVHNVPPETDTKNVGWKTMGLTFTFSKWADPGGVPSTQKDDGRYEIYNGYALSLQPSGVLKQTVITQGITSYELFRSSDFQIKYDINSHTITYEVVVPYNLTNIDPAQTEYMAFSATIALNLSGNSVSGLTNGSNRFFIGQAARTCGKANNFAHKNQCIKIKLAPYDKVKALPVDNGEDSAGSNTANMNLTTDVVYAPFSQENTENTRSDTGLWIALFVAAAVILLCIGVLVWFSLRMQKKKKEMRGV